MFNFQTVASCGAVLLTALLSVQTYAATPDSPTKLQCQTLQEDVFLLMSYVVPCPEHEKSMSPIEKDFATKIQSLNQACHQSHTKEQLKYLETQARQNLQDKFAKASQDIANDQAAYCQGVKSDLQSLVQKYLPDSAFNP